MVFELSACENSAEFPAESGCKANDLTRYRVDTAGDDDDFCYKRVQTPGMSPPRAGAWTYCLFTP